MWIATASSASSTPTPAPICTAAPRGQSAQCFRAYLWHIVGWQLVPGRPGLHHLAISAPLPLFVDPSSAKRGSEPPVESANRGAMIRCLPDVATNASHETQPHDTHSRRPPDSRTAC